MLGGGGNANVVASSGEAAAAPRHTAGRAPDSSGAPLFGISQDINSADEDPRGRLDDGVGGGAFGGNRWPRQETLALLQIRSDMDVAFRDASVKGPLWEDVSRKMADLGYHRSAKKCKEKFENVYKYHKRTKDGRRTTKSDGKTYRFFDQLEALETQLSSIPSSRPLQHQPITLAAPPPATTAAQLIPPVTNHPPATVPSTMPVPHTISFSGAPQNSFSQPAAIINTVIQQPAAAPPPPVNVPPLFGNSSDDLLSNSTSSSTSSDVQLEGRRKRKRKWKDFFERLMKGVIEKQEEMQKRFLETLERREQERMAREEAWRMQEMAKINREREILAQERSMAAAKDTAVMTFLQKLSEQQNPSQPIQVTIPPPPPQQPSSAILTTPNPKPPAPPPPQALAPVTPAITPVSPQPQPQPMVNFGNSLSVKSGNGGNPNSMTSPSSSRWPKVEIEALIKLRTSMDAKYQENCPKGPLWEDISAAMRKLGYNRNAKRCKEKWENINKYFKKVKESNKKRPEDSKTCPYFHQLDALYSKRNKTDQMGPPGGASSSSQMKPENSVPLLVRPEQQWPPASVMEDLENEQMDEEDDCEDDDEEDDQGGGYEIVASKPTVAMGAGE